MRLRPRHLKFSSGTVDTNLVHGLDLTTWCVVRRETLPWEDLPLETQRACAQLWEQVWPSSDTGDTEARIAKTSRRAADHRNQNLHLAFDESDRLAAVARTFEHVIGYGDTVRAILALASVCSTPDRRGEGYGDSVTRAALERANELGLTMLFQTPVPTFYERYGCRVIENEITTSKPDAESFKDPWAMIYPGDSLWDDAAAIDLRIAGW